MGDPEGRWLLASDAGYGLVVRLADLLTDRKAGKAVLSVPEGSLALPPAFVTSDQSLVCVAAVTLDGDAPSDGKLLVFPVGEVPEMPKGKGNKLFNIPGAKAKDREEILAGVAVVEPGGSLVIHAGEKQKTLSFAELKEWRGARAQRGAMVTKGYRGVTRLEAIPKG